MSVNQINRINMKNIELTKEIALKVKTTVECGLVKGLGNNIPGEMCVEAAVCYAYGLPHSDNPPCVGEYVRNFKIALNDSNWSSNRVRTEGMIKLSIAQLNSNILDQDIFLEKIRVKIVNNIISKVANKHLPKIEDNLRKTNSFHEILPLLKKLDEKLSLGWVLFSCGCHDYYDLSLMGFCCFYSKYIAKDLECTEDELLNQLSNVCLEVLIEMKSPGCEYLYLLEENG